MPSDEPTAPGGIFKEDAQTGTDAYTSTIGATKTTVTQTKTRTRTSTITLATAMRPSKAPEAPTAPVNPGQPGSESGGSNSSQSKGEIVGHPRSTTASGKPGVGSAGSSDSQSSKEMGRRPESTVGGKPSVISNGTVYERPGAVHTPSRPMSLPEHIASSSPTASPAPGVSPPPKFDSNGVFSNTTGGTSFQTVTLPET